jgi:hypothetical protein
MEPDSCPICEVYVAMHLVHFILHECLVSNTVYSQDVCIGVFVGVKRSYGRAQCQIREQSV